MRYLNLSLLLSVLLLTTVSFVQANKRIPLTQQYQQLLLPETALAVHTLGALNNSALLQRDNAINSALANQRPILQFAEARNTTISPDSHGTWETITTPAGAQQLWRMTVQSINALSINLAFLKFKMPEGAQLFIYSPGYKHRLGPYTTQHNNTRKQLWTPIIPGDTAIIEVNIPLAERDNLELELTKINHGYQKFTAKNADFGSGACNVDVVCPEGNAWRDQIRSVGVYSFGGLRICSGVAINNSSQDNTPYFLTADHCTIDSFNDISVVIYWNFDSPSCRTGTAANAGPVLPIAANLPNQATSGTTFIAGFETSDFTLVRLNQAIPEEYNVYLAGWDRSLTIPNSAVAIHHPSVEEKRISTVSPRFLRFEANGVPNTRQENNSHIRVIRWTLGTTESGSSGSPLFDQNKRIVGQLSGGAGACSRFDNTLPNDQSDWYGHLGRSWIGGGTVNSRLSTWLDPLNSGLTFLDGKNVNASNAAALDNNIPVTNLSASALTSLNFMIAIPTGARNLRISTQSASADADLYVKFATAPSLSSFDKRAWSTTSNEVISIPQPQVGRYFIAVYGFTDFSNLILSASYDNIANGSIIKTFRNDSNLTILNQATVSSTIRSNYSNIAGTMTLEVDIKHTDPRDLVITLIAPNNQSFVITNTRRANNTQNFIATVNFTIAANISNGVWRLEVLDINKLDNGYINSWILTLP